MRKLLLAALTVGALLVPPAQAEHAPLAIDVDDVLYGDSRQVRVTGTITCEVGRWRIDWVNVGWGPGGGTEFWAERGRCTGEPTPFRFTVRAGDNPGFVTGPLNVNGEMIAAENSPDINYSEFIAFDQDVQVVVR